MSDRGAVVAYLVPPSGSFWAWQDGGQSIAWAGVGGPGPTIAFRGELEAIAGILAPNGLPPLAALVLLLAATRDTWPAIEPLIHDHVRKLGAAGLTAPGGVTLLSVAGRLEKTTIETLRGLNVVAGISSERRRALGVKIVLAQMVFEKAPPEVPPRLAEEIAEELRTANDPGLYVAGESAPITPLREWASAMDALKAGLSSVDEESLSLRQRTGLETLPRPAGEDLSPSQRVRGLLAEQIDDPELGGIVRLGRELLAALNLPRTLHRRQSDEPPAGGIADVSNRGPLDRLLVSELAHDDMTLAVRVAVNEALYLKREPPPQEPPQGRLILLDCGIRTWGVPRALTVSVGLALAATAPAGTRSKRGAMGKRARLPVGNDSRSVGHGSQSAGPSDVVGSALRTDPPPPQETVRSADPTKTDAPPSQETVRSADPTRFAHNHLPSDPILAVFRPDGANVVPVDLSSREGVIDHLSKLDTWPHFGPALASLARAAAGEKGTSAEVFLVTAQDVLDDAEFRIALRQLDALVVFAAGVDREGRVQLWSISPTGRTLLRSAVLDVSALLDPPRPRPAARPLAGTRFPAIFSRRPMPLLVPPTSDIKAAIGGKETGLIAITADRRLLHWGTMTWGEGPRELTAGLPGGRVHLLSFTSDGRAVAVIGGQGARRRGAEPRNWLVVASIATGQVSHSDLPLPSRIVGAAWHRGALLVVMRRSASAFGLESSQPLASLSTAGLGLHWRNGRFFMAHYRKYLALSYDGSRLVLEDVGKVPDNTQTVFEAAGVEGPLALTAGGAVFSVGQPAEPLWPLAGKQVRFKALSSDGTELLAATLGPDPAYYRLYLAPKTCWESITLRSGWHAGSSNRLAYSHRGALRTQLMGVSVTQTGSLALWPRYPGKCLHFVLRGLDLRLERDTGSALAMCYRPFIFNGRSDDFGFRLHCATWPDGSTAWLDSRGMLHLKSADLAVPQVTLVLPADGTLAGWSSDGHVYGPRFYHGLRTSWGGGHLEELIRRFAERLR